MATVVVLTASAVTLIALILPTAAQNATYDPWNPIGMANASTCHILPWARTNPDTPNDDAAVQICPCDYPYHQKERKCCIPFGQQEGQGPGSPGPYYGFVAPYFYGAAGPSVEARKSSVNGKMLCPCGYTLNATDNICYTIKSGKYEDQCPCGTTKSPKNLACYDDPAAAASGTEEWGECVSSPWYRGWPASPEVVDKRGTSLCPCGYYYKKQVSGEQITCCKLKGARAPFYYMSAASYEGTRPTIGGRVEPHGVNNTKLCPCGYYLDDSDKFCYSAKQYKYEDRCACGWAKDSERKACFFHNQPFPFQP